MAEFVHLHVHSHYSLLDGVLRIDNLVEEACAQGMPALALTDHGNLFGAVEFYKAATAAGIRPIIGLEAYVAPGSRFDRRPDGTQGSYPHLTLLAEDNEGYRNLLKLSSYAYLEGFYYKPRVDKELLSRYRKGIIALSGCLSSEVSQAALAGDDGRTRRVIGGYLEIFGPRNFFIEVQDNGLEEQRTVLSRIVPISRALGVDLVATNDIHYLRREDSRAQEVHLCISTGTNLDDSDRLRFHSNQFHFRSAEEMARTFSDLPEAVGNTLRIAERCRAEIDFKRTHLPVFRPDDGADLTALFRKLCWDGCRRRFPDLGPQIRERLQYEMDVIERMGYTSYFLVVWDFIRFAKENGIPVGPGRGSAAGSLVAFSLGITDVDPIRYDLIFERFLNEDRISLPDIDIDFCQERRDRVIDYVRSKYGQDHVSQIITFGTMAARAVIRDVGRALNIPLREVDAIAKRIPATIGIKLGDAIERDPDLKRLAEERPEIRELFEISLRLEGLNRHASTHAAGVVIGDTPLIEIVPLYKVGEEITTQFPMENLEAIGLLKMDFLGLKTLTVLDRAADLVRSTCAVEIDWARIPLDDPRTFELLARGDTKAVFQLESVGMRELIRKLRPDRFEDIIALLALYRPGPLGSGMVDSYVRRKHGEERIEYPHPDLEPILAETNGIILYQEQVMRIANRLSGFTMNEADNLRKAMGKKMPEMLEGIREKFTRGALANGVPRSVAESIYGLIEYFAGYGFNKSHSTAYAVLSYRTAYLKANHPAEFMAAVLSSEVANTDKIAEHLVECRRMGIEVVPPDANTSRADFTVADGRVVYGLTAVKGVGARAAEAISDARGRGGPFRSVYDFAERVDLRAINRTVIENLVKCGAFDRMGHRRSQLLAVVERAMHRGTDAQKDRQAGQVTLFDLIGNDPGSQGVGDEDYPDIPEWREGDLLAYEKESLGFYLSGHPLKKHEDLIERFSTHRIADLADSPEGSEVVLCAQITKIRRGTTKSGNPMARITLEDMGGRIVGTAFSSAIENSSGALVEDSLVFSAGTLEFRDDVPSIRIERIIRIEDAPRRLTRSVTLRMDPPPGGEDELHRLRDVLASHRGEHPVFIVITNGGERAAIQVGKDFFVDPTPEFFAAASAILGPQNVVANRLPA